MGLRLERREGRKDDWSRNQRDCVHDMYERRCRSEGRAQAGDVPCFKGPNGKMDDSGDTYGGFTVSGHHFTGDTTPLMCSQTVHICGCRATFSRLLSPLR